MIQSFLDEEKMKIEQIVILREKVKKFTFTQA